jgi:hypothetical protein
MDGGRHPFRNIFGWLDSGYFFEFGGDKIPIV